MWWVGGFCHPGECLRGHRTEALVSRVWIFTPRHDSHTFGANLRHRHRHTCHRHLRSSWWERHWVNENVMKIWKRWREGMINLINYPFYSASCRARNPMPYLSIDIASYDDKRHCRLKLFIVISSSLSESSLLQPEETVQIKMERRLKIWPKSS